MQKKKKNEKQKFWEREKERDITLCVGKLCIKWEKIVIYSKRRGIKEKPKIK